MVKQQLDYNKIIILFQKTQVTNKTTQETNLFYSFGFIVIKANGKGNKEGSHLM